MDAFTKQEKDTSLYFMKHPLLYRIGIEKQCYSQKIFLYWVLYGLLQAATIYVSCMLFMMAVGASNVLGQNYGFWMPGEVAYGCVIINVNMVLLVRSYIHFPISWLVIVVMIGNYFLFFAIFS